MAAGPCLEPCRPLAVQDRPLAGQDRSVEFAYKPHTVHVFVWPCFVRSCGFPLGHHARSLLAEIPRSYIVEPISFWAGLTQGCRRRLSFGHAPDRSFSFAGVGVDLCFAASRRAA